MKRTGLFALMIALLLLAGCSSTAGYEEKLMQYRETLAQSQEISFQAALKADYGDNVLEYELQYTETAEGATVEIMSPELIAGVKAHVDGENDTLEYDGLILETGDLTDDGLTPVSALPALVESLRSGYLQKLWLEDTGDGEVVAAQIAVSDSCTQTIWLEEDTLTPLYSEITCENQVVLFCTITEWAAA
jgi:hypothetical protein